MIRLQTKKIGIRSEDFILRLAKTTKTFQYKNKCDFVFSELVHNECARIIYLEYQNDLMTESHSNICLIVSVQNSLSKENIVFFYLSVFT